MQALFEILKKGGNILGLTSSYKEGELSTVELDDIGMPLTAKEYGRFSTIDPLTESPSFGIDLYVRALEVLNF